MFTTLRCEHHYLFCGIHYCATDIPCTLVVVVMQVHLDLAQFEKCMTRLRDIKSIKIKGKKFQSEEQKLDDGE